MSLAKKYLDMSEDAKENSKILKAVMKDMLKENIPYKKNAEFKSFVAEALKRAKEKGAERLVGINVMQMLDKLI